MKTKLYPFVCVIGCLSILFISNKSKAQCNCGGGDPATPVTQIITISPTTASVLNFDFQQFDPSIGTLSCVRLYDTLSGSSITGARNTGVDSTDFLFSLTLVNKIAGPGITILNNFNRLYGYDRLAPFGVPGDTITYGPENIITNPYGTASTGGNAAYLGVGTVRFTYTINGGMVTVDGGANYTSSVATVLGGTLALTYYWCPTVVLASGIKNFTATLKDNYIQAEWIAQNQASNSVYELQVSTDGKNFKTIYIQPSQIGDGTSTNYQYKYSIGQNYTGSYHFRIKQTDISGKVSYTKVNTVSLNEQNKITVYPNPITNNIFLQFENALTGDYVIDIVSVTGQKVFNKSIRIDNSNSVQLTLNNPPVPGMYYLRAIDRNGGAVYLDKVYIKQ